MFLLILTSSLLAKEKILIIYYYERYPYYFTNSDGNPDGILNNITLKILKSSKIKYKFRSVPVKRIYSLLESQKYACSPGWFYTKERAKRFKYTLPIYESSPFVAILNSEISIDNKSLSLKYLFTSNLKLGLISGFKYGNIIEKYLNKYPPKTIEKYTILPIQIIYMVSKRRIDYTLLSKEYILKILKKHSFFKNRIKIVTLNEIKSGTKRYLLCSKDLDNVTINKINTNIKKIINVK